MEFSIIIPVYNAEKYLKECLDSVLAQTFPDFELLLINDGSSDTSGAICNEYAGTDHRIKVVHKENGGVSSARNVGLDMVQGKYVVFVDSDDTISPLMLERCKDAMDHDNLDLLQFTVLKNGEGKGFDTDVVSPEEFVKYRGLNYGVGNFFKASVINNNNIRFIENLKLAEDMLFMLTCLAHSKKARKISDGLYFYRIHSASASQNRRTSDMVMSCKEELEFKRKFPQMSCVIDYSITHYLIRMIVNGDYDYNEIKDIITNNLPFDKTVMNLTLRLFSDLCRINIRFAVWITGLAYKILR